MKRFLSTLLAVCMVLTLLPVSAFAQDETIVAAGECGDEGDNVTWTLDSDGTLTISGVGMMYYYSEAYSGPDYPPYHEYAANIKNVVIESGITRIGGNAFRDCSGLTSLFIPDSVFGIGDYAFANCSSLTRVFIPSSLLGVEWNFFSGCTNLTDIYYGGSESEFESMYGSSYLADKTIHYNSGGMGSAGEDPTPSVPEQPGTPDTDTSLKSISIPFYSGLGSKSNVISVDWGWKLFDNPALSSIAYQSYDNRLAVTGLALSAASEQSKLSAESMLRQLGFEDIISYNYDQPAYIIAQPGVTFGHKCLTASGKEQHIFVTVVRGTTNAADIMTDIFSLAGAFQVSGQNIYDLLTSTYIRKICKLNLNSIQGTVRFFVTGHSLGGATCNVLAKKLNESYGEKNVFAYTFASPTTAFPNSDIGESGNIYNILNNEDIVPLVPPTLWARYGLPVWFSRKNYTAIYEHFASLTNGKNLRSVMDSLWLFSELDKIGYAHATETYMSFLLALSDDASLIEHYSGGGGGGGGGGAWCPVNLEIYVETSDGPMLVGRVTDNVIDEELTKGIVLRVDGDKKYFYFPFEGEYKIELTGTDTSTMTFFIQEMDYTTGEPIEGTGAVFENVTLTPDKQFLSEVKVEDNTVTGIITPDVKLYVLDSGGEPEKEVLPDGKGTEVPLVLPDDTYTISFDTTVISVKVPSMKTGSDGKLSSLPRPSRSGYTFDGWFTTTIGGERITTETIFDQDTTVFAHWIYNAPSSPSGPSGSGSSSSSSDPTYSITVPSRVTGGSVTVWPTGASEGSKVTITAKPNSGYKVGTVTVTEKNGKEITVTDAGDGKYTFIMPKSRVDVKVEFVRQQTTPSFIDVQSGAYYADAVAWAVEKGITAGTSAATFSPDAPCTRAQIVTFLWRAAGSPKATASRPFTDVPVDSYYYDAVLWAVERGITNGTSTTMFSPDATCTRDQIVTFLWRAASSPKVTASCPFTDIPVDSYYYDAMLWAMEYGITSGTSTTTFSPNAACTRAQAVTFLYRNRAN